MNHYHEYTIVCFGIVTQHRDDSNFAQGNECKKEATNKNFCLMNLPMINEMEPSVIFMSKSTSSPPPISCESDNWRELDLVDILIIPYMKMQHTLYMHVLCRYISCSKNMNHTHDKCNAYLICMYHIHLKVCDN